MAAEICIYEIASFGYYSRRNNKPACECLNKVYGAPVPRILEVGKGIDDSCIDNN